MTTAKGTSKSISPATDEDATGLLPGEKPSVTEDHHITVNGQDITYKATVGSILIKNDKDKPAARIFYTEYTRTDVPPDAKRPISFMYNGGPGSSSIWLHMGAFGPHVVKTTNAGPTPPAPYNTVDNPNTLLDKTDMVFIDPVGTGFSRALGENNDKDPGDANHDKNKDFWGVDEDIKSLTQFVSRYVSQNNRWNSPKYLIGESYGTFRSVALANSLQQNEGMAINGIALLSTLLDYNTLTFPAGEDLPYELYVPTYAATAWYHGLVKNAPDLDTFIKQAKEFETGEYASALMKGASLSDAERMKVAKKLAHFTGLSVDYVLKADLRVNNDQFEAELLRSRGLIVGRFDSRFAGAADDKLAESASRDPQSEAISPAFTATFNNYMRKDLGFNPNQPYNALPSGPIEKWNWKQGGSSNPNAPNVVQDLAQAMDQNPNLKVQVEMGKFDLATPSGGAQYAMDHLTGLAPDLRKNIEEKLYNSGHMMYLEPDAAVELSKNIRDLIDKTSGGTPAADVSAPAPNNAKPVKKPSQKGPRPAAG